jgi:hypothetical protein
MIFGDILEETIGGWEVNGTGSGSCPVAGLELAVLNLRVLLPAVDIPLEVQSMCNCFN